MDSLGKDNKRMGYFREEKTADHQGTNFNQKIDKKGNIFPAGVLYNSI